MKYIVTLILLLSVSSPIFAELLVTPSRISFSERDRTKDVILMNNSKEVRSYKVEWINQKQGTSGAYQQLSENELNDFPRADPFIRFSPRRVTLQPGESQKVKLMARRKSTMDEPEYRSHLLFTALPRSLTNSEDEVKAKSDGVSIKLNLLLSYSIPIILRTEKPSTNIEITNFEMLKTPDGKELVNIALAKPSENSVYGNFTVIHEDNGQETVVGRLDNVNIFRENKSYATKINLFKQIDSNSGKLKIRYKGKAEFADTVFDEAVIDVRQQIN